MPLADWFTLHFYGPEASSAVDSVVTTAPVVQPQVQIRVGAFSTTVPTSPETHLAIGKAGDGFDQIATSAPVVQPRVNIKMGAVGKVTALSQEELAGSVSNLPIENGLSLVEVLRLLLATAAGDATGLDGNPAFKSADGSKTRVAGTRSGGSRTMTVRDGT
jgi:hypothetical protein